MRTEWKRFVQSSLTCLVVASMTFLFQNCDSTPAENGNDEEESVIPPEENPRCVGLQCGLTAESLMISIANSEPEYLLRTDAAFDVAGFCDNGGYPTNRLTFSLDGPTGVAATTIVNGCDEIGRFRIRVNLPSGYDYVARHILVVTLKGVDSAGREYPNPLGLHRRELDVVGR